MKRFIILSIILLSMGISSTFAQDYESMWKKVEELAEADKPKSIIEQAEKILSKANKENNFPQMLKAQMCITEKRCDLDPELFQPDEYEKLITLIEEDTKLSASDKSGRLAVLHSTLASAYIEMRDSYVHDYDQETQEQFPVKAKEHILAALSDMETLSHIDNTQYKPLISQAEGSRYFNHDLLNVLIDYAISSSSVYLSNEETIDIYERAIKVYEANGNRNASTLLKLKELKLRSRSSLKSIRLTSSDYQKQLEALHERTQDIETGADVDLALSSTYIDEDQQLAFVRKAQIKWKDSMYFNNFKNTEASIMAKHVNLSVENNILANKPFKLTIKNKNATNATLTIREYSGTDKNGRLTEKGTALKVQQYTFTLDETNQKRKADNLPYYSEASDNITLPAGHYTIVAETEGSKEKVEVVITSIRLTTLSLPDGKNMLAMVLDNETGRPVANASILCFNSWRSDYGQKPVKTFTTDANGEAIIPSSRTNGRLPYYRLLAVRNASKYGTPSEDITGTVGISNTYESEEEKEETDVKIFTDRSIYRPGQTVYISTVKYKQLKDNVNVIPDSPINIRVNDPDGKEIFKAEAKTNALGSADFEFVIPSNCKLGNYYVLFNQNRIYSSSSFHVEEYKRPTFDVKFDKDANDTKYTLGDYAKVIGKAMTFSDVPVQGAKVEYTIEWSQSHGIWRWYDDWEELTEGETKTLDSGEICIEFPTEIPEVVYCDSIKYRIKVDVTDVNGEMQSGEFSFKVKNPNFKKQDKEKNDELKDEFNASTNDISETQDAVITFKAKEKDALVYYYVISNNKIESQGTKVLNGNELKFTVKYQKEWGDGVRVLVQYVRNGHYYKGEKELTYVRPEKKLTLAWSTFRDNLQPGQKEEWTLSVKDHNKKVVSGAELLAVMYDASLDEIYENSWEFDIHFPRNVKYLYTYATDKNPSWSISLDPSYQHLTTKNRNYDYLTEFEHQRWYKPRKQMRFHRFAKASNEAVLYSAAAPMYEVEDNAVVGYGVKKSLGESAIVANGGGSREENADAAPTQSKQLRTNLSELAFFYPHLVTDAKGEAHIAFTLPDCLTEWKFMGFVHTKNMDYGLITANATAKKDFMVQPNMPRFLRTGDKAMISAKIINMSEKEVKGTATLRILNAETETEVYTTKADFGVPTNQSTSLTFPISNALSDGDYICEIIASNGTTSDGERNRLPIISTKVDVVENVPFYLTDAGTKSVDLSAIFNQGSPTATDKTISVGYTDNPALPVFKSLRALQNPEHDNAPCFAAALYSNLVLLDMSKSLGDRIDNFDAEAAQATADKALEKLKKLQLSSGAWSWFEGMKGSYYITLSVAENLSRLQSYLNRHDTENAPADIDKMLKKALKYLDKETLDSYKYRKQHKHSLSPSNDDLRYLAIATNPNSEMLNKYLDEMNKDFKNLTIYGRSQGVLIMKKYGRDAIAQKFLESVKEYTVFKEGFGRYFATDQAYYSWCDYRIPTQLAAMRAISANNPDGFLPLNGGDARRAERVFLLDMQLWLLRQKQTQTWDNPINALDIADFLLTNDRETSLHEPQVPELVLNGTSIKPDSIYQAPLTEAGSLVVTKTSSGVSWGHVRSTFKEEVSNLQSYSSGELTIERKVIREGNKVTIRHILHADRDMDFVQVTSQHAASLEPLRTLSGYQWMGGRGCYLEVHDSYISLFFDKFTRGTTTIDMEYYIAREGEYNTGYANIECTYAPEFGGHTAGNILNYNK